MIRGFEPLSANEYNSRNPYFPHEQFIDIVRSLIYRSKGCWGQTSLGEEKKMIEDLEEALKKRFPREDVKPIAEILSIAAEKGRIAYDEFEVPDDMKEDLLLLLENEKLLIPVRTSRTLAWEDRIMLFKSGEVFEMPHVVGHLIRYAERTGEWSPDHAVRRYLEEIGETAPEKILSLFNNVKENAGDDRITPEVMLKASEELDLTPNIGRIIVELKGGGIISPCLRDPSSLRYEINPSLVKQDNAKKILEHL